VGSWNFETGSSLENKGTFLFFIHGKKKITPSGLMQLDFVRGFLLLLL